MRRTGGLLSLLASLTVVPLCAEGADPAPRGGPPPRVEPQRPAVIQFEDETIEGGVRSPEGGVIEARTRAEQENLIRARGSWRDQVLKSSGDL